VTLPTPELSKRTLSESQIYKLLRAGDLELVRIGGSTLISVESIERLIEKGRGAPLRSVNPAMARKRPLGRPRKSEKQERKP
jgi:Helix-turn-helix domain